MRRGYGERAAKYVVDAPIRMEGIHTAANRYRFSESHDRRRRNTGLIGGFEEAFNGAFMAG